VIGRARVVAIAAAALIALVAGCDAAREATDTANRATDKASICIEALRLAGFNPDPSDPQKAAEEARQTSEELSDLANRAADTTLRDALNGMSQKIGELGPEDINPANLVTWADQKVERFDALTRACA
jgi:hypothetical protein